MWNIIGISGKRNQVTNSIPHPLDENRKIWTFSDAVHVVKCIRNNIRDKIEVTFDDKKVNLNYYRKLYCTETSPEFAALRACPKLTSAHIDATSFQKMNVRLAFQLLSKSVAKGINFYRSIKV